MRSPAQNLCYAFPCLLLSLCFQCPINVTKVLQNSLPVPGSCFVCVLVTKCDHEASVEADILFHNGLVKMLLSEMDVSEKAT